MERIELISLITGNNSFDFEEVAIRLCHYQYKHNEVYRSWVDNLDLHPNNINSISDIPFLPISAFKSHKLRCERSNEEVVFTSSMTTGSIPSRHYVFDLALYLNNADSIFREFYGEMADYCFFALLPSYLERKGSSLVAMVDHFISNSRYNESGFYLYDHERLYNQLMDCKRDNLPTILFGVSFALLDFIEKQSLTFPALTIIETGGMKGRKKEITREDLHDKIARGFGVRHVHSEYGMTELFSQAYSKRDGIYLPGKTMSVFIKDLSDPFQFVDYGKSGVVNIIDLANIDSCAFIETQDLGRRHEDGSFEILGRMDVSDIRGCNLMVGDS